VLSRFKFKWYDWLFVLAILIAFLLIFAGNSGVAHWVKQGLALVGTGLQWVIGGVQQLITSIGK
jgi:hypothetical protein